MPWCMRVLYRIDMTLRADFKGVVGNDLSWRHFEGVVSDEDEAWMRSKKGREKVVAHREGRTRSLQIPACADKSLTLYPIELGGLDMTCVAWCVDPLPQAYESAGCEWSSGDMTCSGHA